MNVPSFKHFHPQWQLFRYSFYKQIHFLSQTDQAEGLFLQLFLTRFPIKDFSLTTQLTPPDVLWRNYPKISKFPPCAQSYKLPMLTCPSYHAVACHPNHQICESCKNLSTGNAPLPKIIFSRFIRKTATTNFIRPLIDEKSYALLIRSLFLRGQIFAHFVRAKMRNFRISLPQIMKH